MKKQYLLALIALFGLNSLSKAQWTQVKGTKGNVISLSISGSSIVGGTYENGILVSNDDGKSWKNTNKGLAKGKCKSIRSIVRTDKDIFAGGCLGVFSSSDNGLSWNAGNSDINNDYMIIEAMEIKGSTIFAGDYGSGIYISKNNGKSWSSSKTGLSDKFITSFATTEAAIFAGTNKGGVFTSTDEGKSWTAVNNGLPSAKSVKSMAAIGNTIFAGTDGGGVNIFATAPEGNGVYVSTDNGANWSPANKGIENKTVQSLYTNDTYVFAVLKEGALFSSNDNGKTWTNLSESLPKNTIVNSICVKDNTVYAGTNNGIFTNTNIIKK